MTNIAFIGVPELLHDNGWNLRSGLSAVWERAQSPTATLPAWWVIQPSIDTMIVERVLVTTSVAMTVFLASIVSASPGGTSDAPVSRNLTGTPGVTAQYKVAATPILNSSFYSYELAANVPTDILASTWFMVASGSSWFMVYTQAIAATVTARIFTRAF